MIYLIRHGLDDETYIGGWSNGDLIEKGKSEIIASTNFIIDNHLNIERIISSDIKRAVTTSSIINSKLNVPITYTSNLRELNKGNLNGKLKSTANTMYKDILNNNDIHLIYPNGESMIILYNRVIKYLKLIENTDNTLLVTHRGVINMIYYYFNNIKLDMDKEKFNVTHGSVHEMNIKNKIIERIY